MKNMKVREFILELQRFPEDMEIVCVGDYIESPSASIERYAKGDRDEDDNLIIRERVEIH